MADTLRALAIGRQTAAGTPAATLHWLNFLTDFSHKPNLTKETPKFKVNHRWMERKTFSKTRYDEVTIKGFVDSTDIGWLLCSAYGPPTDVSHAHTFLAGATQALPVSGANSMLLTVAWMEGLSPLWWQMTDAKVNKISFNITATGDFTFEATLRGLQAVPLTTGTPTPTYSPPPDNTPFEPWQTYITKGGVAACVVSAKWDITNNYDPFYCTPVIAPVSGQDHGLFPSRFTDGEVVGSYEVIYEYTADAGSSFYDYRHDVNEAWIIESTDPDSATGLGYTPTFHVELPVLAGTSGELDRSKPNVLQSIKGSILYGATLGSGSEIVLTNGLTGYTAT